jgi:hypothetical protein
MSSIASARTSLDKVHDMSSAQPTVRLASLPGKRASPTRDAHRPSLSPPKRLAVVRIVSAVNAAARHPFHSRVAPIQQVLTAWRRSWSCTSCYFRLFRGQACDRIRRFFVLAQTLRITGTLPGPVGTPLAYPSSNEVRSLVRRGYVFVLLRLYRLRRWRPEGASPDIFR